MFIKVRFTHPRKSSTFPADVDPTLTAKGALQELLSPTNGPFLSPLQLGQEYRLVLNRTKSPIPLHMTMEQAGVVDKDILDIIIISQTGEELAKTRHGVISVRFTHPRKSSIFPADVDPTLTAKGALQELLSPTNGPFGPFLSPLQLGQEYCLVLNRTKSPIPLHMTMEQAGVVDEDILDIIIISQTGEELAKTRHGVISVRFTHPRKSSTFPADVDPTLTAKGALQELLSPTNGPFLSPLQLGQEYRLVLNRTKSPIPLHMTMEQAGVVDTDTLVIVLTAPAAGRQTPETIVKIVQHKFNTLFVRQRRDFSVHITHPRGKNTFLAKFNLDTTAKHMLISLHSPETGPFLSAVPPGREEIIILRRGKFGLSPDTTFKGQVSKKEIS